MAIKWEGALEKRRIELLSLGYSCGEIAEILSVEFNEPINWRSVDNRRQTVKRSNAVSDVYQEPKYSTDFATLMNMPNYTVVEYEDKLFPEECYENDPELCMTPEKIKELNKMYNLLTGFNPRKVLSLSDLHAPFIDFKSVEKAVLDNPDADICLLNGDVLDLQAMSRFDKMTEIDLDVELKQVFTLLDVLTKRFKYVVWVGGNHDLQRFLSYVMKNFAGSMKKFVLKRLNPIDYIAEKYDNLIVVPHDWVQIGDVIFAHLQNFSSVDMKTVVTNNEIFNALRDLLPNPNYRGIVIGHTHHIGKLIKNGVCLIEQGCLCVLQDYKFSKPTKNRWESGYAIVNFDDEMKVKFNDTNAIYIDK